MEIPWVIVIIIVVIAFIGSNLMLLKHSAHLPIKKPKPKQIKPMDEQENTEKHEHKDLQ
ncbi:DUF2897 family protein [Motilimonas pumila]|uniref:DUF2897 family protein n=1 Tax=Motilimonas pumila TaxID=2303987 RepID=A0A418YHB3_9GAMM|nr:DUF2897 family protein [Motilimonas pumila]RJG49099.1 DUF2897 family protein [Motilimonas pumila]